jgi:hypothetical protein
MISQDNCKHLVEKAKTKPDGVYSARGYKYAVRSGKLIGWGEKWGDTYLFVGFGGVFAGKVKARCPESHFNCNCSIHPEDIVKALRAMI